jgi:hypothetical protein
MRHAIACLVTRRAIVLEVLFQSAIVLMLIFPNFIMAQVFGNFSTALTAYLLGDKTAQSEGFLSLNPLRKMDLTGTLLFITIILTASMFFGKSPMTSLIFMFLLFANIRRPVIVPINEENFNNPILGECAALLAGPLGSMLYSFLALCGMKLITVIYGTSTVEYSVIWFMWNFLDVASTIGIQLGVFDLIPLPPQASGRVIQLLIPEEYEEVQEIYSSYGIIVLLGLLIIPGVSNAFLNVISQTTFGIKLVFHKIIF